jgi:hypothetical protein
VIKGTLGVRLGGLLTLTLGAAALVGPSVASADVAPVKGLPVPAPATVVQNAVASAPKVDPVAGAAVAPVAAAAVAKATETAKQATETAKQAPTKVTLKPLPAKVLVTRTKLTTSASLAAVPKKGHIVIVLTTKNGKTRVQVRYGAGARRLLGNQANCHATADGGTDCVLPLDGRLYNTCADEGVNILPDSWFHDTQRVVVSGMTATVYHHLNWQNVHGVSDTGTPYSMMDVTKDTQDTVPLGLGVQVSLQHDERQALISQGPKPNQYFRVSSTTVFTVDPVNGVVVVDMQPPVGPEPECHG